MKPMLKIQLKKKRIIMSLENMLISSITAKHKHLYIIKYRFEVKQSRKHKMWLSKYCLDF